MARVRVATSHEVVAVETGGEAADAERAVLGAVLFDGACIAEVPWLAPHHFGHPLAATAWQAMRGLGSAGSAIDLVTVAAALAAAGTPASSFLTAALGHTATSAHVAHHARIVLAGWHRRELLEAGRALVLAGEQGEQGAAMDLELRGRVDALRASLQAAEGGRLADSGALELLGDVAWLWESWVPLGYVTLLAGQPGIGKSMLLMRFAQSVIFDGFGWPDGSLCNRNGHEPEVGWIDTEGAQQMTRERRKLYKIPADRLTWPIPAGGDVLSSLSLDNPEHLLLLDNYVANRRPALVAIDSLRGAIRGDENASSTMLVLQRLAQLATRRHCAIVLTHHLNKPKEGQVPGIVDIDRIRGSSAIIQFCRSVLALDKPDAESEVMRLRSLKSNLGKMPEPMGVEHGPGGLLEFTTGAPEPPRRPTATGDAMQWLRDYLDKGPCKAADVFEAGQAHWHNERTLERAAKALQVIKTRISTGFGGGGAWYWCLGSERDPRGAILARQDAQES